MKPSAILLAALLLSSAAGCRDARLPAPAPDPRVEGERIIFPPRAPQLAQLGVGPAASAAGTDLHLFGRLTWDDDVTARVFTPFAGRVRRVLVDAGQAVARGTPLAEVESPDFGQAQADARTAESDLRLAESALARLQQLYDHGAAARKDLEAAAADVARARFQGARAAARLASCGAAADTVSGLFVLRSPIAGTVVERTITPGQEIRPDQMLANAPQLFAPLFVVSDPRRLWIEIDATASELAGIDRGTAFRFLSDDLPARTFGGRVDLVAESVDPATHTLRARGTVENPDRVLKAETFVRVTIPGPAAEGVAVPASAVFLKGDRHYLFVERAPGCFERREVRVGAVQAAQVLVSAGVRPGDRVVTDGCILLEQLLD